MKQFWERICISDRVKIYENGLRKVCLPYHSPHKFRHGHAVYALKNSKDISALKAVSQNLMHSNLSITDGVYGMLSEVDRKAEIGKLGQKIDINNPSDLREIKQITRLLLKKLEAGL